MPQATLHVPEHLRALNPEQREAAMATEGPVLILAGAGSGKTRTLVFRIAHLVAQGVDPRKILAVTFTNRAAAEMRERVAKMVGRDAKGVTLSTFHSLGARILREHGTLLGLPKDFAIYASADQAAAVKKVMTEEVAVTATAGDDKYDVKQVVFRISDWKNRLVTPADAAREVAEGRMRYNRKDDYAVLAADVYPRYEQTLRAAGAADFDDLLLLPVRLLTDHLEAREAYWRRWQYIMIDEYQDTNGAQLEMARLLAGPRKNLCVVGDDDQSIYAWRGADVRNILDFERHFPGAKVVVLEENYRSTQRILDAANGVIAHNTHRKAKRLRTGNGPGPKIDYWEMDGAAGVSAEGAEAEMVAREIGVRRFAEKLQWGDFAVLYRTNLQARPIEEALRAANVPYRVVGGTSVFERKEVADAVAYLRVALNPKDEVSLRRIINYPTRGIGRTTLLRVVDAARAKGVPLWEMLWAADGIDGVSKAQWEAIRQFVEMMEEARVEYAATDADIRGGGTLGRTLHAWARDLIARIRLEEAIRKEFAGAERAMEVKLDILRDFVSSIGAYEERTWARRPAPDEEDDWDPPSLREFLERISLTDEEDKEEEDAEPNLVTLMTLHSAKGLEFSHVFLLGLEEEILPHARSVQAVTEEGVADPIAEERRLFYVGITRARHRLTLSSCATRRRGGEDVVRTASRFLKEVPQELLEVRSGAKSSLTEEQSQDLKASFWEQMRALKAQG
jgi:superfamily I DNA/RNA helicase